MSSINSSKGSLVGYAAVMVFGNGLVACKLKGTFFFNIQTISPKSDGGFRGVRFPKWLQQDISKVECTPQTFRFHMILSPKQSQSSFRNCF